MSTYRLLTGLIGTSLLLQPFMAFPTPAQETSSQAICENALLQAEGILVNDRDLWITNTQVGTLAESGYQNFPYQRPISLGIGIDGEDAPSMMNSPQLLTTVSTIIMNNCNSIGLVTFWVAETDYFITFGMIGNRVRQFECVEAGEDSPLPWGYEVCF